METIITIFNQSENIPLLSDLLILWQTTGYTIGLTCFKISTLKEFMSY